MAKSSSAISLTAAVRKARQVVSKPYLKSRPNWTYSFPSLRSPDLRAEGAYGDHRRVTAHRRITLCGYAARFYAQSRDWDADTVREIMLGAEYVATYHPGMSLIAVVRRATDAHDARVTRARTRA